MKAVMTCSFLVRVHSILAAEEDYEASLEMLKIRSSLHTEKYSLPATVPSPITPETFEYPMSFPARSLTFEEIANAQHVQVTATDVEGYRQNPNHLSGYIFSSERSEGIVEAFRVSSILTTESRDNLFYLTYAGEGPEAVCYSAEDFYALLPTSTRLILS
ncbi:hypothetical protein C8J57DRAFT_1298686 [Mycena rebaudengoi]|nr:hypothetical protein C8J57DRAFT_1298686 [Mycena rebaudengoi]